MYTTAISYGLRLTSYNTQLNVPHKHIYYYTQVEISAQLILKLACFMLLLMVALGYVSRNMWHNELQHITCRLLWLTTLSLHLCICITNRKSHIKIL